MKTYTISCQYRIFTCITIMEHFDTFGIPVLNKSMMTVELKLVSFSIVMTLNLISSVVNIFSVFIEYILYQNRWWVLLFLNLFNIIIELLVQRPVPFIIPKINLIEYHHSKSFRVSSFRDERLQGGKELVVAVRGNAHENLPIVRNGMCFWRLVYHLVEVEGDGVIVPLVWGHHLVQHLLTLE